MKRFLFCVCASGLLLSGSARGEEAAADDPLGDLGLDMQLVVGDLTRLSTGDATQETENTIVGKLDDLIAKLEKECEACKGGASGANPSRPLADSTIIGGPGGSGDMHAAKKEGKNWGELPAKERDRILQSMTEGFPTHYQEILKRYYRRLAEETPVTDPEAMEQEANDDDAGGDGPAAAEKSDATADSEETDAE